MTQLQDLNLLSSSFPLTEKMPVLFMGHGNPMNAIEENEFVTGFKNIAQNIPTPSAILCISAHWLTNGTKITAMEMPKTIHDFSGFPQELFDVQYPAKGSPSLAKQSQQLLLPTAVELDSEWGLDHGTWSVLRPMFPNANIPVIQMSIDYSKNAQYHFDLAKQLSALRNRGVLIMGSGNIIHNLRMVDFANIDKVNYGFDWAIEAREKSNQWLLNGDFTSLIDYHKQGKAFELAIPTPDHYFPLIYALGLKQSSDSLNLFNDKLLAGSLSMTSVRIG